MKLEIKPKDLLWDKANREHIKKHDLTPRQVEQVFVDESDYLIFSTYESRLKVIGKCGRKILAVILSSEQKKYYIVSARIASKEERQLYRQYF